MARGQKKNKSVDKRSIGERMQAAFGDIDKKDIEVLKKKYRAVGCKHLDLTLPAFKQPKNTWETIETELLHSFPEFQDKAAGNTRLKLAVSYLKRYFRELNRRDRATAKVESGKNESVQSRKNAPPPLGQLSMSEEYNAVTSDSLASLEIKGFLESFNPSLVHLQRLFVDVQLVDEKALQTIASWPRPSLIEFLESMADADNRKLSKVAVEAIAIRLEAMRGSSKAESDEVPVQVAIQERAEGWMQIVGCSAQ
ncbi:hypothetical protein C8R43DRAFT_142179 [Mycena crocata]|nr:hypothetical protein C8R43DRAFT_142179 [Mycena crocata]